MAKKKSIITDDLEHCIECGRSPVQLHHIFGGNKWRQISDSDGLIIPLCFEHHTGGKNAIHFNRQMDLKWKKLGQLCWEEHHPGESFLKKYGKNYVY